MKGRYNREYYLRNREKIKTESLEYYYANRERILEQRRRWRRAHRVKERKGPRPRAAQEDSGYKMEWWEREYFME